MRTIAVALSALLAAALAAAAPLPAPARAEVDALLNALQASGCEFNRNGSWYGGAEAKSHLLQKLDYLERRGLVRNAEGFIELAASTSSMSGKAYLVRCGSAAPVESKVWLSSRLQSIRAAAGPASAASK